jgi:hypothetical protein
MFYVISYFLYELFIVGKPKDKLVITRSFRKKGWETIAYSVLNFFWGEEKT